MEVGNKDKRWLGEMLVFWEWILRNKGIRKIGGFGKN